MKQKYSKRSRASRDKERQMVRFALMTPCSSSFVPPPDRDTAEAMAAGRSEERLRIRQAMQDAARRKGLSIDQ